MHFSSNFLQKCILNEFSSFNIFWTEVAWGELAISLKYFARIGFFALTRARVAVSATFAMVGGGGGKMTPAPLTRKLGKLEDRAIRRSTALSEPVRSHFGHFFAQANIEVSRGHQRSNFRKMMVLSGMPAIISGTIIVTPNPKKRKIALETLFC